MSRTTTTGRRFAVVAVAAVTVLALGPPPGAAASGGGGVQPVRWQPCADAPDVDCGTVTVPVDWSRPRGETIEISLARRRATDPAARVGALLMDPGGPGGPGAQIVRQVPQLFSAELHRRFDVIGFDPRGVGESHPVLCSTQGAAPFDVTSQAEFEALRDFNRAHARNCRGHTGRLYDFVDTISVAHDMDAIRAAIGERRLNYLGISYGTLMGQQYAELYPHRVGRFVLDSNMDHSLGTWEFLRTETTGVELIFDEYVAWCARTPACVLHGTNVRALHHELLARAARGDLILPDPSGDVVLTPLDYLSIVRSLNYGPDWFFLAQLMADLRDAGGSPEAAGRAAGAVAAARAAQVLGIQGSGRGAQGAAVETYEDPFQAIFCADWFLPVRNFAELQRMRERLERVAPDMKLNTLAWGATLACVGLEHLVRNPQHRLRIRGTEPMLFVNSAFDPATPLEWGVAAASQARQRLLVYRGWGHFSYEKSTCVSGLTDRYLITGALPGRGVTCPPVEPVEPPQPGADARRAGSWPGGTRW